ncbi:MAG: glycine dehydrogenase (aminomethyl-transferring), partial [Bacteroidota bacterium]
MYKLPSEDAFVGRHIGPDQKELDAMLETIGIDQLSTLIDETVPEGIRMKKALDLPVPMSEYQYLKSVREMAKKNKVFRSYIGLGYYGTITPSVILRNIFENPGWYTQYTPYQAEIAQGRLEALLNFQTMVSDLTGLPIANASLLDEGTAAAEAMTMFYGIKNKRDKNHSINRILVSDKVLPQTIDILRTRALPVGINLDIKNWKQFELGDDVFAILLQYPDERGKVEDFRAFVTEANAKGIYVIVAADLMSLALLSPPGEWGADAVVGVTQRFGIPMGFGGPHAAYFATKEDFKRNLPGRIIGVSIDRHGNPALRMALQTREQHIR